MSTAGFSPGLSKLEREVILLTGRWPPAACCGMRAGTSRAAKQDIIQGVVAHRGRTETLRGRNRRPAAIPIGVTASSRKVERQQGSAHCSHKSNGAQGDDMGSRLVDEARAEASLAQKWDPGLYQRHCAFVSELGMPVLDLLDPQPGENLPLRTSSSQGPENLSFKFSRV